MLKVNYWSSSVNQYNLDFNANYLALTFFFFFINLAKIIQSHGGFIQVIIRYTHPDGFL